MAIYLLPFGAFAFLAVLSQFGLIRVGRIAYAVGVLWIGLFAGLRFETGQDWPAYESYFSEIGDFAPFESKFELGYYLLNYVVKSVGGTYSVVLLLSSLFCAYSVHRLTSRLNVNRFYILTIYMGYSFLILHFAQVRQSLAVAFFILAVDSYLRGRSKLLTSSLLLVSPLFQISSLIYIAILVPVLMWQSKNAWWWIVLAAMGATTWTLLQFFGFDSLLAIVANTSTQEKIAIYQELKVDQGIFQVLYAGYLLTLAGFLSLYADRVSPNDSMVVRYAIASLVATAIFAFALAGFYVFYSRSYAIACLFQGVALAIVFAKSKKSGLNQVVFCVSLLVSCISYWRLLTFYSEEYTPYRIIFGSL